MDDCAYLAGAIIERCLSRGFTVAVAESCTGGLVCHELTNVPGSSGVLLMGVVAYTDGAKKDILGVDPAILERCGTIHEDTGRAMATAVRELSGADFGVAVTGAAGPDSPPGIPVGTVICAVSHPEGCVIRSAHHDGGRARLKMKGAADALNLLLDQLGGE